MKKFLTGLLTLCFSIFLIPGILVPLSVLFQENPPTAAASVPPSEEKDAITAASMETPYQISLYLSAVGNTLQLDFEDYIAGIVAEEMSPTTHPEALKAQAVAARSYMLSKIAGYLENGIPPEHHGALLCTDYNHCKNWTPLEDTKKRWDPRLAEDYAQKIQTAVQDTRGEYLIYGGKVAKAFFFAASSGKTESAADVWGTALPYLQSVPSENDLRADGCRSRVFYPMDAFWTVLKGARPQIQPRDSVEEIPGKITYTAGGSVATAELAGEQFKGTEIQELFQLRSACFTLRFQDGQAVFDVKGHGHGVGMSQFGANDMANTGKNYREILEHYYTGVTLVSLYQKA